MTVEGTQATLDRKAGKNAGGFRAGGGDPGQRAGRRRTGSAPRTAVSSHGAMVVMGIWPVTAVPGSASRSTTLSQRANQSRERKRAVKDRQLAWNRTGG